MRGPALADVAGEPFALPEIARLSELRAAAAELAVEVELDAGRHRKLSPAWSGSWPSIHFGNGFGCC